MVWRWRQRFAEGGVDGLLRDKTRKPGKPPILAETVAGVVVPTRGKPPGETTPWTGRAMTKAAGISLRSVHAHLGGAPAAAEIGAQLQAIPRPDSSASTSTRRRRQWCHPLMKRARSRRSTASSQRCR